MQNRKNFDLSVYVIIDPEICGDKNVAKVAGEVLAGGATFIQLRNKSGDMAVIEDQARRIMAVLAGHDDVAFVINDYVELAAKLGVDGVHIGQGDMDFGCAREIIGEDKILGLTAFTPEHYDAIDPDKVDYVGTGPVFPTLTKPDKKVLGIDRFGELVSIAPVPVVGIGGITPENAGEVIKVGAAGVAMIRSVVGADDPMLATRSFVK